MISIYFRLLNEIKYILVLSFTRLQHLKTQYSYLIVLFSSYSTKSDLRNLFYI